MKTLDFDNIENEIPGYKYVLEQGISIDDPLVETNDRICVCDTRDECIEEMKKHIESYEKSNETYGAKIEAEPYTITRLGTYIKWKETTSGKTWWWTYGIYPVKYVKK